MQHLGFLFLAFHTLLALTSAVAKKNDKVKNAQSGRTCGAQSQCIRCRVPCNWKKEFGADCKYKFESWGSCVGNSGTKARQGTLKKVRYNAQCQEAIHVTKPCALRTKAAKTKAKKGKGKD
ncbi:Midkine [Myotis brandtii]|uniref:Midkine n=1 Tax=Myotis brandtii TaxID=109478 RepID=S7PT77_MYOBR|nr:Midkine [Myotis brandtii]